MRGTLKNRANLALRKGVIATSDSTENESLSAYMAIDGDDSTLSSRWSSENNWEDASHYIQLEFPEEISVSFVVLKWERRNAVSYALEGSLDGETWTVLQSFDTAPEMKHQEIALEEAARVRFLRLSTYAVSMNEGIIRTCIRTSPCMNLRCMRTSPPLTGWKRPGSAAGRRAAVIW